MSSIFRSNFVIIIYPFEWINYVINFLHLNVLAIINPFEWVNYPFFREKRCRQIFLHLNVFTIIYPFK
ncbi:putative membrane protein [Acanthamoeba polyphaga mimivirus]|nr:putative membrane protein [Acanthamoeba polyphaga mimivirus]